MTTCLGVTMVKRDLYNKNNEVITLPILKVLNKSSWRICHNEFSTQKWETIFQMIVSADIEKLEIQRTYVETALKSIAQIQFGQLLQLNLEVNNIRNIESLCQLNAPSLQRLRLSHNLIVSARPLKKLRCKYLTELMLEGNYIIEWDFFYETNFSKKLKILSLQNWNQKQCQGQSLQWLVKSKLTYLLELYEGSERRMKETRVKNALTNKFQMIKFKRLIYE